VVSKSELQKRRVRAEKQEARHHDVVAPNRRRQRRTRTLGVAFLALMLVLPLTAGLIAATSGDDPRPAEIPVDDTPLDTTPPALVDPGYEGLVMSGPTPCPVTDGTQERVTAFAEAPPMCVGPTERFTVVLDTLGGDIDLSIDAAADPVGANLFVTLARYGVYDGAPIYPFPGVVTIGGVGDAGFRVPGAAPPADGRYPVGSIVMLTDFDGLLEGQVVVVTDEAGSAALEIEAVDPIIGTVTEGLGSFDTIRSLQDDNPGLTYRVQGTAVSSEG